MRIIEVSHCSMISHHYKKSSNLEISYQSKDDVKKMLAREYGGKKDRVGLERVERMKINVDIVRDQLDKTAAGKIL